MTAEKLPPSPYPADLRAKGWRFELDHERIVQSDTWALASPYMRPWLLMTWLVAWQQTPCGSLPNSDELIAARIGLEVDQFIANRKILLRGWWLADDDRLYHSVITGQVVAMLERKHIEKERKAAWRANKPPGSRNVPQLSHGTDVGQTRQSHGADATGTGTGTVLIPSLSESAIPTTEKPVPKKTIVLACPFDDLIDSYEKHLPMLPFVRRSLFKKGETSKAMGARWEWVMSANHEKGERAGQRLALTVEGGIDWFDRFFAFVSESRLLTGQETKWMADLGWLMKAGNFAKVIQGNYLNREAA